MLKSICFDVVGVTTAKWDILGTLPTSNLEQFGLEPGCRGHLDLHQWRLLCNTWSPLDRQRGSAVAHTVAGMAALGSVAGLVVAVGNDDGGREYVASLKRDKIRVFDLVDQFGSATAEGVVILNTDDVVGAEKEEFIGDRTICSFDRTQMSERFAMLRPEDVDIEAMMQMYGSSKYVIASAVLLAQPNGIAAFEMIAKLAKGLGSRLALSLSSASLVERCRDVLKDFLNSIEKMGIEGIVLFGNESEICVLAEHDDPFAAISQVGQGTRSLAVFSTMSNRGAIVWSADNNETKVVSCRPRTVVSALGAGDAFAAAVLHSLGQGNDAFVAAQFGNVIAGHVVESPASYLTSSMARRATCDFDLLS